MHGRHHDGATWWYTQVPRSGFDANPNIDAATVRTLASCEWIKRSQPLCLIGDSGSGKSHMLLALGTEAAMKGYRVRSRRPRSW